MKPLSLRARPLVLLALAACSAADPGGRSQQHEITVSGELLTTDGRLREPGWSRRQLLRWDPARVDDPARLRQWDFFTVLSDAGALNLSITDIGFAKLCSVGLVDFATGAHSETSDFKESARDDFALSPSVEGSAALNEDGAPGPAMRFDTDADTTRITIDIPASLFGPAAQGAFTIGRRPSMPYLSLATPFPEDPHFFFYEQKIPGLSADGAVTLGGRTWSFPAAGSTAVMDWGRGEWPTSATWRWAAASGVVDGASLAFNLGEGFGDDSAATENLVIHADLAHKLAQVDWSHDPDDPMRDWTFRARDGRLSLVLHPIAQELGGLSLGDKYSRLRKAYGRYAGTIVLDDGRAVRVDGLLGFAEEMSLAW